MAEYSIGEAERLTGLPAHTLRYWEENIPFIRPRKDDRGRRIYSSRDVELFLRIKELVQVRKFTLEGAGDQLVGELTAGGDAVTGEAPGGGTEAGESDRLESARKTIADLRGDLLALYELVRNRAGAPPAVANDSVTYVRREPGGQGRDQADRQ